MMTGRHTLYGQSLVRSANSLLNLAGMAQGDHWVKSWIKPPKKQTPNGLNGTFAVPPGISSGENTNSSSTPQPQAIPVYEFEVHAWVRTEEIESVKIDLEKEEDVLDLSRFAYDEQISEANATLLSDEKGPLTDADIRGAVGGDDMIGFSSSAAKPIKPQSELKEEEVKAETTETPSSVDTPVVAEEVLEEVKETPDAVKDEEGDVKME